MTKPRKLRVLVPDGCDKALPFAVCVGLPKPRLRCWWSVVVTYATPQEATAAREDLDPYQGSAVVVLDHENCRPIEEATGDVLTYTGTAGTDEWDRYLRTG